MVKIGSKTITHIYQGSNLITDDSSNTKDIKLGNKPVNFVYQGNDLLYPNPIKDGLVLWYDFKGMKNSGVSKDVVRDLSGKGNNGILQNFAYTSGSGYNDGLKFDGIDDYGIISLAPSFRNTTYEIIFRWDGMIQNKPFQVLMQTSSFWIDGIFMSIDNIRTSIRVDGVNQSIQFPMTDYLNKNTVVTRVLDSDNKVLKLYLNGNKVAEKILGADVYEKVNERYYLNSPGKDTFSGNINSLKVYNKPLTDQEIQHNYQLEKERWGL
ncbi:LamG-like jellyroll fold domain-containing protein [Staphylococcus saprophyticus]|uniref:LamG-like jellyroll fold domain-containing protein n=1 Tax=Staphylococcus saprophyticus TaxID=29385 RepID=UPI00076B8DFB|nr:LamG-like jellyroll fold domain-containing protein [Staphylococcus saprophyticus]AMG20091.1 hypothetical protein AL528_07780 [Staphylococcus saprophyticus]